MWLASSSLPSLYCIVFVIDQWRENQKIEWMNKRRLFAWFVDDQVWRLFSHTQASAQRSPSPPSASNLTSTHKWWFNKTENFLKDNRQACIIHIHTDLSEKHHNKDEGELMMMIIIIWWRWWWSASDEYFLLSWLTLFLFYSFSFGISSYFHQQLIYTRKLDSIVGYGIQCYSLFPPLSLSIF